MRVVETIFNNALKKREAREKKCVLVIEDEAFSRQLIVNIIKDCNVIEAGNGKDAIAAYALNAPEVTFLDIEMPGANGLDVLKAITEVDKNAYIVMLTSHTSADYVQKALDNGAKGYIAKPFNKEKILSHIAKGTTS